MARDVAAIAIVVAHLTAKATAMWSPPVFANDFKRYPGYPSGGGNPLDVSGTVSIVAGYGSEQGAQVLTWDLSGLDTLCTAGAGENITNGCGIHVHTGTTCENHAEVGGHYFDGETDPWAPVVYVADSSGRSRGTATVHSGVQLADLEGKAFVVHELAGGGRVACGVLGKLDVLRAPNFHTYPDYPGALSVKGTVTIEHAQHHGHDEKQQLVKWDLKGLDVACTAGAGENIKNGCGIHVHTGTTCASDDLVGGHYFDGGETDPWAPVVYVADGSGNGVGQALVDTGLSLEDMVGRAFVVHELAGGGRIACAILFPSEAASPETGDDKSVDHAVSSGFNSVASLGALGLAAACMLS